MLTKSEVAAFRRSLTKALQKQTAAASELARETQEALHARSNQTLPDRPERQADSDADVVEQEIDLALLENTELTVHETEAALARITAGTFGICSVCEQPIAKERLKALPTTRYCIRCARNVE